MPKYIEEWPPLAQLARSAYGRSLAISACS